VQTKIEELRGKIATITLGELNNGIDAVFDEMRSVSLTREDVSSLKNELYELRRPFLEAQENKAKELEQIAKEKLQKKREQILSLKEKISHFSKEDESMELEALEAGFEEIKTELESLELSKMERQQLDRTIRPLRDLVAEKKEHSLLNLSEDDKKTLENLKTVLGQKKERRLEIKEQLEIYRKTLGGSNLDFEKSMQYQELVEQEKERLEKANSGISEIEEKISDLES